MKKVFLALLPLSALWLLAGCASPGGRPAASEAVLMLFRADSNVRDPAANDAYPGVRRIALRAIDGRLQPDSMLQLSDRFGVPAGERALLFAAESSTGTITLSEVTFRAEAGVDYVALPEVTSDHGILVRLRRGMYGEVIGVSTPWTSPDEATAKR